MWSQKLILFALSLIVSEISANLWVFLIFKKFQKKWNYKKIFILSIIEHLQSHVVQYALYINTTKKRKKRKRAIFLFFFNWLWQNICRPWDIICLYHAWYMISPTGEGYDLYSHGIIACYTVGHVINIYIFSDSSEHVSLRFNNTDICLIYLYISGTH